MSGGPHESPQGTTWRDNCTLTRKVIIRKRDHIWLIWLKSENEPPLPPTMSNLLCVCDSFWNILHVIFIGLLNENTRESLNKNKNSYFVIFFNVFKVVATVTSEPDIVGQNRM